MVSFGRPYACACKRGTVSYQPTIDPTSRYRSRRGLDNDIALGWQYDDSTASRLKPYARQSGEPHSDASMRQNRMFDRMRLLSRAVAQASMIAS